MAQSKLIQAIDRDSQQLLEIQIKQCYSKFDLQKRYQQGNQKQSVSEAINELARKMTADFSFVPDFLMQVIFKKQLKIIAIDELLAKITQRKDQFITRNGCKLLIKDLNEIQSLSLNFDSSQKEDLDDIYKQMEQHMTQVTNVLQVQKQQVPDITVSKGMLSMKKRLTLNVSDS